MRHSKVVGAGCLALSTIALLVIAANLLILGAGTWVVTQVVQWTLR